MASDTGELVWNRELPGKAYWTVNTSNTKLFSGFPEGREIAAGRREAVARRDPSRLGHRSRSPRGERRASARAAATVLLAATGVTENQGTVLEATGEGSVALADRLDWGDGTVLAEGIPRP